MFCKLIGSDEASDIALLKIDDVGYAHHSFGDSEEIEVGDLAITIGNPYGLSSLYSGSHKFKGQTSTLPMALAEYRLMLRLTREIPEVLCLTLKVK